MRVNANMRFSISSYSLLTVALFVPNILGCLQLSCRLMNVCVVPHETGVVATQACDFFRNHTLIDPATNQPRLETDIPNKLVHDYSEGCSYVPGTNPVLSVLGPESPEAKEKCPNKSPTGLKLGVFLSTEFMVWRASDIGTTRQILPDLKFEMPMGGVVGDCKVVKTVKCQP